MRPVFIQWITDKMAQRTNKTKHEVIKLRWKQVELEKLIANKENMTPEEFRRAYNNLIQ